MDLLYERMKQDIIEWYEKHYFSDRFDIVPVHLDALYHMYNPARFLSCADLEAEKIAFLTEVHASVWG